MVVRINNEHRNIMRPTSTLNGESIGLQLLSHWLRAWPRKPRYCIVRGLFASCSEGGRQRDGVVGNSMVEAGQRSTSEKFAVTIRS